MRAFEVVTTCHAEGVSRDAEYVLINNWLGRFMDPLKSGHKDSARSHASDLLGGGSEAFWCRSG